MTKGKPELVERVRRILPRLRKRYPDARTMLNYSGPFELLVATILAAQCTDERVNRVTASLFRKYRSAEEFARADLSSLEQDIRPTGFFRMKAKSIKKTATAVVERFGGQVPEAMEELTSLGGVGRKTANVVLGVAFGKPAIIVDTHVNRVVKRIGLSNQKYPDKIEMDLRGIVPQASWTEFSHLVTFHGRNVCKAPKPSCLECVISSSCDYFGKMSQKMRDQARR